ncbi:hypothetical protein LNTAR_06929 [Lentisphaera araneosa HTCC2155]|uniref:Uncharacterized protein n=1 Tax=Lentisphaera araneosa HTCC2155 TaxID=313628 RepID=A6DMS1_9BACT|nr:hypothetical protein [Lentisphaera araneosa]EDM26957.1 hypothetical protein LNTAR_06929 [Lentisphaera araneosa HTCC2155]
MTFFSGEYDLLLCSGNYYNENHLYKRNASSINVPSIEKINMRVKMLEWQKRNGVWRAEASYSYKPYTLEAADAYAIQVIEGLYGEK